MIGEWNASLCIKSRFKKDFIEINEMYILLQAKGYKFPKLREEITSLMVPKDSLKSEEELEEEEQFVYNAVNILLLKKLRNLLQKQTPAALEEANDIIKLIAGYV